MRWDIRVKCVGQDGLCISHPAVVTLSCVLICALVSGCAQTVKISYPSKSEIHPEFDRRYTTWEGERVEVNWTPSLRAESSKYLAEYDRVLLANSIHEKGLRHEYKIAGKGTPLVVYTKIPSTLRNSDTIRQAALRLE